MGDSTLFVRHLPSSLTKEDKEDLLRHFGAVRVRVMGNKGALKHTAFAEFPNKDIASEVLGKLHQTELLGCRLVVEFAHSQKNQHLPDEREKHSKKEEEEEYKKKEEKDQEENEGNTFDFTFLQWGLKYPRRRRLCYLYPPPSPSILANISHALAACPKLYVQVLHLMNKMDLPAPFGPVTAQPPMAPDVGVAVDYADKLEAEEMEVSSTEESELESDPDTARPKEEAPQKRKATNSSSSRKQMKKRARLAMSMFHTHHPTTTTTTAAAAAPDSKPASSSTPAASLEQVFEQSGDAGGGGAQRRIQLRLPTTVTEPAAPVVVVAPSVVQRVEETAAKLPPLPQEQQPPLPPHLSEPTSSGEAETPAKETPQSTGFGVLAPVSKTTDEDDDKEEEEVIWGETKFISRSELRKGRLSRHEMEKMSIFRNYKEGDPSRRLYIKNVAKQVTEEDLHWVFGRYVNWDKEGERNIFDIRLMKEGRMKGQAFVTLGTDEQAAKAVKDTNAFLLKGKPMVVHFARSAKQQEESKS